MAMLKPAPYVFDYTGINPNNKIIGEQHVLTHSNLQDFHFIVPKFAPYYEMGLKVTYQAAGSGVTPKVLKRGEDYELTHHFSEGSKSVAQPLFGSISLLKRDMQGVLSIDYQTLGGDWLIDEQTILKILADRIHNPKVIYWDQVAELPYRFPVTNHDFNIKDLYGAKELTSAILSIATTITDVSKKQYSKDEVNELIKDKLKELSTALSAAFGAALNEYEPPVTKNHKKYIADQIIQSSNTPYTLGYVADEDDPLYGNIGSNSTVIRPALGLTSCNVISVATPQANQTHVVYDGESGNLINEANLTSFDIKYTTLHNRADFFKDYRNPSDSSDQYKVFIEEKTIAVKFNVMLNWILNVMKGNVNWYAGDNWDRATHPEHPVTGYRSGIVGLAAKFGFDVEEYIRVEKAKSGGYYKYPQNNQLSIITNPDYIERALKPESFLTQQEKDDMKTNGRLVYNYEDHIGDSSVIPFKVHIRHCKFPAINSKPAFIYPIVVVSV